VTGEEIRHYPGEAKEVFDVSGAGDTVVATLAAALAVDVPLADAARLANIAAGIVVGKVGTAVARQADIAGGDHARHRRAAQGGDPAAAAERPSAGARAATRSASPMAASTCCIPAMCICWNSAAAMCDRLIVGINSDASVKRLKGPARPAQGEAARAAVLASLASVDLVCLFEDDTPLEILKLIKPDLLIKGADYTRETVVGATEVESWGGSVALAELLPGHSTTATLARLRG
jgi:D-beta-D-heptose 7-phosphate kinase/D-beta-D-heptose 1-phosphate adenosyltransferase